MKNIHKVSKEDILNASKKHFLDNQAQIVVTGKGNDILTQLEKIAYKGKLLEVHYYDQYGTKTKRPDYSKSIPEGVTATSVIENYLNAIGGREKLKTIHSINENAQASMQGNKLEIVSHKTDQIQMLSEMKMMGNLIQKQVVNKTYAYVEMQGQKIDMEGEQLEKILKEARIFPELELDPLSIELIGLIDLDEKKAYEIKIADGLTYYYDEETNLKVMQVQTLEMMGNSQTNTIKFGDFKKIGGILFPHRTTLSMGPQENDFLTQSIVLNPNLKETLFE